MLFGTLSRRRLEVTASNAVGPLPERRNPMRRALPGHIRIFALIVALLLVQGCREREQLAKEAPALARADLRVERIAIAGVVSDAPTIGDTAESRDSWSRMIG